MPTRNITKITPPTVGGSIVRPRLFSLLDAGCKSSLIWVTAPGGAGKSTLVASWLAASKRPHLWLRLDTGDHDPASFFHYLGLAAVRAFPHRKKRLPHLTPEYTLSLPTFTRRCFEALCLRLTPAGLTIVLDNYQEVAEDAPLHDLLPHAVEVLPAGAILVVISRSDCPPAFARLKIGRNIVFLGWNEIRFTEEEVGQLLEVEGDACGKRSEMAAILQRQTDGWAAGLRLMLASPEMAQPSVPGGPEKLPARFDQSAWRNDIFAYFANEVMRGTEPVIQNFLMITALLPLLPPSVAAKLTGRKDAARILGKLSRQHYFTDWHSGPTPVYRYHPLFHTFLRDLARRAFEPDELLRLRRSGVGLLAEAGFLEEAVELSAAIGELDREPALLQRIAWPLLAQGRSQTVWQWLAAIPEERLAADPGLLHLAGRCRFTGNLAEARAMFKKATEGYDAVGDHAAAIRAGGGYLEAIVVEGNDYAAVDPCVTGLTAQAIHEDPAVAAAAEQVAGIVLFGLAFRNPTHPALPGWLVRAEAAVLKGGDPAATLRTCNYLMAYYMFVGDFPGMGRIMTVLGPLRETVAVDPSLRLLTLLMDAYYVGVVRGETGRGMVLARQGIALGRETGVLVFEFWFSYLLILDAIAAGEEETVEEKMREMLSLASVLPLVRQADLHVLAGLLALIRHEWSEAISLLERAVAISEKAGVAPTLHQSRLYLGMACLGGGDPAGARRHFALAAGQRWLGSAYIRWRGLTLAGWCALTTGDRRQGLFRLRQGFALGRRQGIFFPTSLDRGIFAAICATALDEGIEPEYTAELIRLHRLTPPADIVAAENWPWQIRIRTLGGFAVLRDGRLVQVEGGNKPLEMLKALIAFGGRDVPEERLQNALWPDADGDAARSAAKTTLHRLRKGLGGDGGILLKNGRFSLADDLCRVDALAFLAAADSAMAMNEARQEKILAWYRGPFLLDDPHLAWAMPMRERLRRRYIQLLAANAGQLAANGRLAEAAARYEQAVESDELDEDHCRRLMECYSRLGRQDKVALAYERCRTTLAGRLGIEPSPELQRLRQALLTGFAS